MTELRTQASIVIPVVSSLFVLLVAAMVGMWAKSVNDSLAAVIQASELSHQRDLDSLTDRKQIHDDLLEKSKQITQLTADVGVATAAAKGVSDEKETQFITVEHEIAANETKIAGPFCTLFAQVNKGLPCSFLPTPVQPFRR